MPPLWITQLHQHLLQPDSPDLIGRGHRQTYAGDPNRRLTVGRQLVIRWLEHRHLDRDPIPQLGKAKKAAPKGFALHIADRRKRA